MVETPSLISNSGCFLRVPVARVEHLELTAVDGHQRLAEEFQAAAHGNKPSAHVADTVPLSRRKSGIILKSGARRLANHISLTLRCPEPSLRGAVSKLGSLL